MTAQITDMFIIDSKEYNFISSSERNAFFPKQFGIVPYWFSTGCYRGYFCEYEIENSELKLKNLFINTEDKKYPDINDMISMFLPGESRKNKINSSKEKKEAKEIAKILGIKLYADINIPIKYTGKLLLGNHFLTDYYIHMGIQKPWTYEEVKEFNFVNGVLFEVRDCSHIVKKIREFIPENDDIFYFLGNEPIKQLQEKHSINTDDIEWWFNGGSKWYE